MRVTEERELACKLRRKLWGPAALSPHVVPVAARGEALTTVNDNVFVEVVR